MGVLWSIPAGTCSLYSRLQLHPRLAPALLDHTGSNEGRWSIGLFTLAEHLLVSWGVTCSGRGAQGAGGVAEAVRGDQVPPTQDDSEF